MTHTPMALSLHAVILFMLSCRLLIFFSKLTFSKMISGTLYKCQMVWIHIRTDVLSVLILGPNCLQMCSADDKSHR